MMSDTSPEVQARFDALLRQRSGSDRVVMACDMFDCAKRLVEASIRSAEPQLGDTEVRVRVFRRFYADDLDPATIERVIRRIRAG
jgi:hypothetical protein